MKTSVTDSDFIELKALFCECFGEDDWTAEEIVGYARKYGEIHFLKENNRIVTMLCLAELESGIKYLFAVATAPDQRKKGLFAKNLTLSVGENEPLVCIPENKTLFPLYEKLGFTQTGFVYQTGIVGDGSLLKHKINNENIDFDPLYTIYRSSSLYPKKTKELFVSTMKAHLFYNGSILSDGSFYALTGHGNGKNYINEFCVPAGNENNMSKLIKGCTAGKTLITVSAEYAAILKKEGFHCIRKKIYALKSEAPLSDHLYINILYN